MHNSMLLAIAVALAGATSSSRALAADAVAPSPAPFSSSGAYTFGVLYTGEIWDEAAGGVRRGGSYLQNLDLQFKIDAEKAFGWKGGEFVAEGFYANAMSTGNNYVGAVNAPSLIDTGAGVTLFRLYQLYYDQDFGATDVRFGIYDLDNEFSILKPMTLFLNANLATNTALDHAGDQPFGGTIGSGTYPFTPLALRIRQMVTPNLSLQLAIADGVADNPNDPRQSTVLFSSNYGALFIGEVDYTPDKYTKLMAGGWALTSKLPYDGQFNADGSQRMIYGEAGAYFGGETRLYKGNDKRGLDGFFVVGASTPHSTDVEASLNAGLVYTGLFDIRPADKIGIAMNVNHAGADFSQMQAMQGSPVFSHEVLYEATYRAKINEYLSVQPDVQYVVHPGYDKTIRNALAFGIHFELAQVFKW